MALSWLTALICACSSAPPERGSEPLELSQLPLDQVKRSGQRLASLPLGLHELQPEPGQRASYRDSSPSYLLIHGFGSEGYEWVYSAHVSAARGPTSFWRWDWAQCPAEASAALLSQLTQLAERRPQAPIIALGHSYGGLILAKSAAQYQGAARLEAHVIAAPLAGHPKLSARCGAEATAQARPTEPQVKLIQWKTRRALDGAFQSLSFDAQASEAPHTSLLLGERYRAHRLGHNWSISAVIDRLKRCDEKASAEREPCWSALGEHERSPSPK